MNDSIRKFAREVIESEVQAVRAMSDAIGEEFERAVKLIQDCPASVLTTGVGKAGHVARKLSATFASTGTPSHFLSPADSLHGDLGSIRRGDVVLVISASGESDEILRLLSIVKKLDHPVIAITAHKNTSLGKHANIVLPIGKIAEACPLGLAPSSTTTAMLALGDALALTVMKMRNFTADSFAVFHPAGQLGRKLIKVKEAMTFIRDHNLPLSHDREPVGVVLEKRAQLGQKLDEKEKLLRLPGAIILIDAGTGKLSGIFTDGDLRRLVTSSVSGVIDLSKPIVDVMTRNPKRISAENLASEAMAIMRQYRIDELPVIDEQGKPIGLIDIQDLVVLKMLDFEPDTEEVMRTLLLIFGTVLLIVLVGGLYVWMQPAAPPPQQITVLQRLSTQPAPPALAPTTSSEDESVIKASENAWFKVFDEKNARLLWRIRTAHNDPQPDGSINVTEPEAEFYLDNGNRILLHGKSGHVIMPGGAMKNPDFRGPIGQPSRGELYDVTISIYPTYTALQSNLVCKVNNISFDNDTLRITTEPFKEPDGKIVPADQVPVQVRGDEMDFDGRGLTILWNARTRELQLLEVAHGESLVAKTGFSPGFSPTTPAPNTGARGAAPARRGTPAPARGGRRSGAAPQRQVARGAPTTTTKPATTQPVYRAIFEKDVSVTQGDVLSAKADVMRVDYRMDNGSGVLTSPTPPAPPVPAAPAQRGGTRRGARSGRGAPLPTTSTAPAPGIVRWTGKLTILALDTEAQNLGPGEKNIEMSSQTTPVVLDYDGKELKCASFSFSQGDQSLIVRSSPQVPLISMADADGSYVTTPSLRYTGDDDLAVLEGKSTATMLLGDPDAPEIATLNWTDSGMFTMSGKIGEQMSVQQADFSGDVVFTHPKFNLKSQTLQVVPAPTTAPSLEHMEAHGNVVCDMMQEKGSPQHITTDSLIVKTAPGPDGPQLRTVIADGSVHSFSDEKSQDLVAGSMEVTLGPTTRPGDTPPIEHIVALRQVVFSFVDSGKKTTGKCDTLDMSNPQTDMELQMSGQLASLTSDQSTLRGAIINIKSKEQTVSVIGPGILEGAQAMSEDSAPQNFKVTWNRSFDLSLLANHGEIRGDVVVLAANNGWNTTATGDTLAIELMDAPATQPATQASTQPTTAPGGFASMGAKTTKSVTLDGNSVVKAIYTEQDPTPLRQVDLYAPAIRIDEPQDQKRMKMSVPSAGRMLYQTAQKPTTNPATNPTTMATTMATTMPSTSPAVAHAGLFGDMSGPTAFGWSKELVFDPASEQVQFNGAVIIDHKSTAGATYRLEADQVTAKIPSGRDASTATPTDFTFKRLDADGSVHFYAQRIAFDASHMDYQADTQLLSAEGREGTPVRINDAEGASAGSFDHVMFNTVTQDMQLRGIQGRVRN